MSEPQIPSMEEAYKFFNAELNPDGSLTRRGDPPTLPASPEFDPNNPDSPLSRDIPLNAANNTFIRLFRPCSPPPATKLPLIIYFHGGGFVFLSATSNIFHKSCARMSAHTPALIASVEYRLAPEHRLPAAYDDAMDAVMWVKSQALSVGDGGGDPWMKELADFSKVYLMGSSAGANIVYHTGRRALDEDLRPMKIVGLIMNQPFFGGVQRTGSELRYYNDRIIPLHGADLMWSLSLPESADRGHEYCDPLAGGGPHEEEIRRLPVTLVRGYSGDPLVDKQKEFAEMMVARGGSVVAQFIGSGHHAVEIVDPKAAEALYDDLRDFVASVGVDGHARLKIECAPKIECEKSPTAQRRNRSPLEGESPPPATAEAWIEEMVHRTTTDLWKRVADRAAAHRRGEGHYLFHSKLRVTDLELSPCNFLWTTSSSAQSI